MHSLIAPGLALIFDMDGVVVDSNPVHREAWAAFNRRFGLETTEDMHHRMYGKRNDFIIRDFYGDDLSEAEIAARGAAKEEIYRQMASGNVEQMLVPGLRAFLERHRDVPMAVASNAEPENVEFILAEAGLRPFFQVVIDGHQVANPKPHPEIYRRAAEMLGVAPANCVVFEDSLAGVGAARGAGMRVIGIRTTHGDLPNTDLLVDDFLSGGLDPWLEAQTLSV